MSHTVTVKMIADQEIYINHQIVNIHDIESIVVDSRGVIMRVFFKERVQSGSGLVSDPRKDE